MQHGQLARTPKQIGAIIQRQRKLLDKSQSELAHSIGLRQERISKIEDGSTGTRIAAICDLLAALDLEFVIVPRSRGSAQSIEDIF